MTTIIIVDDDEEILAPLEKMLSAEGYFVKAFSSSLKAEAYLKGNSADLAIFDIKMPELNGFFLLRSVRSHLPNLPVVFLSSKADEQDQIIGFTLGADDYITKPFSQHLLLMRVAAVLRRHRSDNGSEVLDIVTGVCQISCPPNSCGVSDFRGAVFAFWVQPDGSCGLPVAGLS
jgi:two-component system, OmpR family, response regulator ChvI